MIDGNARDFLNKLYYEDHYVVYNGDKYFLNGCQTGYTTDGKKRVKLEVYNLSKDTTVYSVTKSTVTECIECRCSDRLTQNSSMEMTQNSPRL